MIPAAAENESNFELEEWEMVCNKCEGRGTSWIYTTPCSKCQGKGKVDWIENIVGRKPLILSGSGSDSSSSVNYKNLMQAAFQRPAAQQLANKIDQEIVETLVAESEQNNKMKAAAVLSEIGRCNFW